MNILVVAPSSYLLNGAEALVNAKHIKLMCDMGYSVDLVCRGRRKQADNYPTPNRDFFFSKVASVTEITVDTEYNLNTIIRHIKTLLKTGYVYRASDWSYYAINACEKLIKDKRYDFILTKDYPSEIVGLYLSKRYGIKWVSTWNDPYIWEKFPVPYGEGLNHKESFLRRKLIKDITKHCYKNVFPSARLRDYMLKYMYGMNASNCVIMPHIMMDLPITDVLQEKSQSNVIRMIHAGALGKERNPEVLFKGVSNWLKTNQHGKVRLSITLMGVDERSKSGHLGETIKAYGLEGIIEYRPSVDYFESLKVLQEYDVCIIIEANCEEGIFLPSKVSDYLQSDKTIFSISPKIGVLNDLYKDGIVDYCADVADAEDVKKQLERIVLDFENNSLHKEKDKTFFSESYIKVLNQKEIFA